MVEKIRLSPSLGVPNDNALEAAQDAGVGEIAGPAAAWIKTEVERPGDGLTRAKGDPAGQHIIGVAAAFEVTSDAGRVPAAMQSRLHVGLVRRIVETLLTAFGIDIGSISTSHIREIALEIHEDDLFRDREETDQVECVRRAFDQIARERPALADDREIFIRRLFGSLRMLREAGAELSGPLEASFEGADFREEVLLRRALHAGQALIEKGLGRLKQARSAPDGVISSSFGISETSPEAIASLNNFIENFELLKSRFGKDHYIVLQDDLRLQNADGEPGYVSASAHGDQQVITVRPNFFSPRGYSPALLVHETTHLKLDTHDYAYSGEERYADLSPQQHLKNGPSYEKFLNALRKRAAP